MLFVHSIDCQYFLNRNCLLCVIAETYTKIKQRFYCTYYYIGIPMWQLLSFQEQILIIWWVFFFIVSLIRLSWLTNLFVCFEKILMVFYMLIMINIIAGSLWWGSREGIRHLAGLQGFSVTSFLARSFHNVSVKFDVKRAFLGVLV